MSYKPPFSISSAQWHQPSQYQFAGQQCGTSDPGKIISQPPSAVSLWHAHCLRGRGSSFRAVQTAAVNRCVVSYQQQLSSPGSEVTAILEHEGKPAEEHRALLWRRLPTCSGVNVSVPAGLSDISDPTLCFTPAQQ